VEKQAKFKRKYNLSYPLLADITHGVAEAYGVWQQKSFMGKKYMGVARTTFVIDENGRIAHVFEKVKPEGHAAEVTAVLNRRAAG
jgi:peroxiredoxin Q/BCP